MDKIIIDKYRPKSKEELREMQGGIGGSDIGAILGVSKRTAYEVFLDKTAKEPSGFEANEIMEVGWELELYVMYRFTKKYGHVFHEGGDIPKRIYHPTITDSSGKHILRCSWDGILVENGNELWVYEGKCTTGFYSLTDLLNLYFFQPLFYTYILDAYVKHHGLNYVVKGYRFGILSNLSVLCESYEYDEERKVLAQSVVDYCLSWWEEHVVPNKRPELVNEDYKKLIEFTEGGVSDASEEIKLAIDAYHLVNRFSKRVMSKLAVNTGNKEYEGITTAEGAIDTIKQVVKNFIAENQFLYSGISQLAELKQPTKKGSRVLKLTEQK